MPPFRLRILHTGGVDFGQYSDRQCSCGLQPAFAFGTLMSMSRRGTRAEGVVAETDGVANFPLLSEGWLRDLENAAKHP